MRDSVVIVTGALGGMGRAIARRQAVGHRLLLCDVSERELAALCDNLPGVRHEVLAGDIAEPGAAAVIAARVQSMGSFAGLVHAAGLSPTMAEARRILDVNLIATARLVAALQPLGCGGSSAVLIASIAGHNCPLGPWDTDLDEPLAHGALDRLQHGLDPNGAYAVSKRGVMRIAARQAPAWGARGARINSLSPGLIETPMSAREFGRQPRMAGMLASTPLLRLGTAEEIADGVDFLMSDRACFVTGTDLLIDGGLVAAVRRAEKLDT